MEEEELREGGYTEGKKDEPLILIKKDGPLILIKKVKLIRERRCAARFQQECMHGEGIAMGTWMASGVVCCIVGIGKRQ